MASRRLLIVTTEPVPPEALRVQVRELGIQGETDVRVVSPASKLTRLQWLANDEDEARERAGAVVEEAASAVESEAGSVEAEVGDVDPLQAAEDALRTFAADELVVVVGEAERASWLERESVEDGFERLGLPVRYLVVTG